MLSALSTYLNEAVMEAIKNQQASTVFWQVPVPSGSVPYVSAHNVVVGNKVSFLKFLFS